MIAIVAAREIRDHLRSFRYQALCGLLLLLMPLGAWTSARRYHDRLGVASALMKEREKAAAGDPRIGAWGWRTNSIDEGLRVIRRPSAFAVWATGADEIAPLFWQFGPQGVVPGSADALTVGDSAQSGSLDFLFVTQVVVGILTILLTFDAVVGERERGTLRSILAAPVPRRAIIVGKFVGVMVTVVPAMALGAGLAFIVATINGVDLVSDLGLLRALLTFVGATAYVALLAALGLLVSTVAESAKTALVVSVGLWTILLFVAPRIATLIATAVVPVESAELTRLRRSAIDVSLQRERQQRLADAWSVSTGSAPLPEGQFPTELRKAYAATAVPVERELFRKRRSLQHSILDEQNRHRQRQLGVFTAMSRLSPASLLEQAMTGIAGTSMKTMEARAEQVELHQRHLEATVFDRVFGTQVFDARTKLMISWLPDPSNPEDRSPAISAVPQLTVRDASWREIVSDATLPLALFLMEAIGLLCGAVFSFQRYDAR
jgi:ABC-type transport system involved in multi-copper enzyme maturation permease subunit